jgi:hypothetical protein
MDLQEVGGGCGDWMVLAQDRDRWRALVNKEMNLRFPKMRGISWLATEPVSFSRRTPLHGVSSLCGSGNFSFTFNTLIYVQVQFTLRKTTTRPDMRPRLYKVLKIMSTVSWGAPRCVEGGGGGVCACEVMWQKKKNRVPVCCKTLKLFKKQNKGFISHVLRNAGHINTKCVGKTQRCLALQQAWICKTSEKRSAT